jgi:hypothetical protein
MDLSALRRWWPLAAVIGLLFVASLAATRSAPQLDRIPPAPQAEETTFPGERPPTLEATPERSAPPELAEVSGGLPDWAATAALIGLAVVLVVCVVLIVVALIRERLRQRPARVRRRPTGDDTPIADDIVAVLDAGLLDLSDTDQDPRRAVIACWLRLEQAAAAAGTPRQPGDTPGDLVGRLLAEQQVDASVLAELAAVYREARYAVHTVDERMRTDARTALQRLRADLAAAGVTG